MTLWLADGVRGDEIVRFAGYELIWVIAPGLAVYELMTPPGPASRLRRFVLGWAVGHVLEVLAFALTAAIGARALFTTYPLAVLLPAAGVLATRRRRGAGLAPDDLPWTMRRLPSAICGPWAWAVAGVCLVLFLFAGVSYFVSTPLLGDIDRVVYTPDTIFHISIAAEALHHWPITNPNVSGMSLDYYWFVHAHYAAASQVTGIGLPVIVLALDILPMLALLICELSLFGAMLARRWAAGPLAALLALLVSEVDLTKPGLADAPFNGSLPSYLVQSPTFLFGAIFFVPMVMLLCESIASQRQTWRHYLLIALLAIGCGGAKGPALPVAVGGLAVYVSVRWLRSRRLERPPLIGLAIIAAVMMFFLVGLYGSAGGSLHLALPGAIAQTEPVTTTLAKISAFFPLRVVFWGLAVPLSLLFALIAPLLGLFWLGQRRGAGLIPEQQLALAMLAASLVPLLVLQDDARNEQFFFMYGLLAGIPVGAGGLCLFFDRWRRESGMSYVRAVGFAALWSAVLSVLVFVVGFTLLAHASQVPLAYLALYLPVTLAVLTLGTVAARSAPGLRQQRAMYAVLAILITAGVNAPLDFVPSVSDNWAAGRALYVTQGDGLTPSMQADLAWVREHTDADDVLALSPPTTPVAKAGAPLNFYAAALAERRIFLEGWGFTPEALQIGFTSVADGGTVQPFPARLRLERRAINRAEPAAISRLARHYGVTRLLVNRVDGNASPLLRRRARLVHSGWVFDVYAIGTPERGAKPQ